jgi:hypothetical protein
MEPRSTFQFRVDEKPFPVPSDIEDIRLAADLAIFHVALPDAA